MIDGVVVIKNYLEGVVPKKYFYFGFGVENNKKIKSLTTS